MSMKIKLSLVECGDFLVLFDRSNIDASKYWVSFIVILAFYLYLMEIIEW